jgi:hypothetical protein
LYFNNLRKGRVIKFSGLLNECTEKPYHAHLFSNENKHHVYAKAPALAYSFRELDGHSPNGVAYRDRPVFIDDNARPHRDHIVREFKQQETTDFIGRKVNQCNTQGQTIAELTNTILEEWPSSSRNE